jgi:hypothetical protein
MASFQDFQVISRTPSASPVSDASEATHSHLMSLANYRSYEPCDPAGSPFPRKREHRWASTPTPFGDSSDSDSDSDSGYESAASGPKRAPVKKFHRRADALKLKEATADEKAAALSFWPVWGAARVNMRKVCLYGSKCKKAHDADHLEKYTHSPICSLKDVWKCIDPKCENMHHQQARRPCEFNERCTNSDCQFQHTTICPHGINCSFFKARHSCVNLHIPPVVVKKVIDPRAFQPPPVPAVVAWNRRPKIIAPAPEHPVEQLSDLTLDSRAPVDPCPVPMSVPQSRQVAPAPVCVPPPAPAPVCVPPPASATHAADGQLPPAAAPPGMAWVFDHRISNWYLIRF